MKLRQGDANRAWTRNATPPGDGDPSEGRTQVTTTPTPEGGGMVLFHRTGEVPTALIEAAQSLQHSASDQVTLMVGPGVEETEGLWKQFAPVLSKSRDLGVRRVLLMMSDGAVERDGRPAPARRIRDEWQLEVVAPSGLAVVVPGGYLFATDGADVPGNWWRFTPGSAPKQLGPRYPAPRWQAPLGRLAPDAAEDHVVEAIPAGILVRTAHASHADVRGIRFTVPIDVNRASVLVGVPGAPEVSAEALATVIVALPASVRERLRLVPGGGGDLLPTAQEVANLLGAEVEVTSGLPVLMESNGAHRGGIRIVTVTPSGDPAWQPYVGSVVCIPSDGFASTAPRIGWWRPPVAGLSREAKGGVLRLDDRWQLAVTRAGLWVGPLHRPGLQVWERPLETDVVAIDLGLPGQNLDDSLWPVLDRLLSGLESSSRTRAMIQVHGQCSGHGLRILRRLAVKHGAAMAARGWLGGGQAPVIVGSGASEVPQTVPVLPESMSDWAHQPSGLSSMSTTDPLLAAPMEDPVAPVAQTMLEPTWPSEPVTGSAHSASEVPSWVVTGAAATSGIQVPLSGEHSLALAHTEPSLAEPSRTTPPSSVEIPMEAQAHAAATPAGTPTLAPRKPHVNAHEAESQPSLAPTQGAMANDELTGLAEEEHNVSHAAATAAAVTATATPSTEGSTAALEPPIITPSTAASPNRTGRATKVAVVPLSHRPATSRGGSAVLSQTHQSTQSDRVVLRGLVGVTWEQHSAAIARALTRMPALRGRAQQDDARADLVAVRAYLTTLQGPMSHGWVKQETSRDGDAVQSFLSCLASGLRRLPSHRGAAIRSLGLTSVPVEGLLPGQELYESAPLSALTLDGTIPSSAVDRYLIWSVLGRRVRPLLDQPPALRETEEIVFGPGTRFRVLEVRDSGSARLILLRELPDKAPILAPGNALDPQDTAVLARLHDAAETVDGVSNAGLTWPERCSGLVSAYEVGGDAPSVQECLDASSL
ncbi:hypothetical protein [Streptomyces sp. NPDC056707]|uniref:hypothetical protein n=1 Tax=Streptomyces sp. NPDC056707 TaxID=3345919 RepID=UPI0036AFCD1B